MRKSLLTLALIASIAGGGVLVTNSAAIAAPNPSAFDPGRIIDDAVFYDPGGMGGVSDIQRFLDAHVPACDTWGTRASGYGNLTNAQYAQQIQRWPGPPYVCLDNYHENPTTGETSFEKGGGAFAGGQSAAQIIYNAAQDYRINPKVLLVLLRKESLNLFSDSWPLKSQYKYAMGYACPDSGPGYSANCDSSKAGFLKQVRLAAWQLREYYNKMGSYNFAPGRWNTIQYSPDPNCGTKNVYIQNYATASLYIYTPYVPNDAALRAYPGTAHCGAYGNRNFWYFWQEWFGSTLTNGNFVRTVDNATVYLIGDKSKYPVADPSLIAAANLGSVGFVSQTYLDGIPTGHLLGRTIQSPDGTIYFFDSGIKLPFTSCEMVADYGGGCGGAAILSQAQIDKLSSGPIVTRGMKTTSGRTYYIDGGERREVLDDQSLLEAGVTTGYNLLSDAAFNYLPYGVPYVRSGIVIQSRQEANNQVLKDNSMILSIKRSTVSDRAFSGLGAKELDEQSIQKLPAPSYTIKDSVSSSNGMTYLLTNDGKKRVPSVQSLHLSPVPLSASTVDRLNGSGSVSSPPLLKYFNDATVFVIVNGQKRPLVAMDDLKSITGENEPYLGWVNDEVLDAIPTGNVIVGAGRLVKTPSSATVYMTDGYDRLVPMSSFDPAKDLGVNMAIRTISDSILAKYTVDQTVLPSYVVCDSKTNIGLGGRLYGIKLENRVARTLQEQTCNVFEKSDDLPRFVRTPDGTIFELKQGVLSPIGSMATYLRLSSEGGAMASITHMTAQIFPKGALIR